MIATPTQATSQRPTLRFAFGHPAHVIALGFGAGLAPRAAGTIGTLWAWAAYLVLDDWVQRGLGAQGWGLVVLLGTAIGLWACTRTAQDMGIADPGAIVWDEVLAFWLVLWVLEPSDFWVQLSAFAVFRYFDAAKPGPVGWADRRFKRQAGEAIAWRQGAGILFDDFVAAGCTLLFLAIWVRLWNS
ncbi:MAG: phosphatidylglycerophosphatase A [Rubrivivax sp.]|nr:phosphatidylglycerophosphatase A [Rubrivivax sp.]